MASLRSQNNGLWDAYGHFTMMLNLNPASKHMRITFKLAGHDYGFTSDGTPDAKAPDGKQRWRILARNPYACAKAAYIFLRAFCSELLHFPVGAEEQHSPEICMFGRVMAYSFKPETNSRGEIHFHGLIIQPLLLADNLQATLEKPELLASLNRLLDACSAAYLPGGLLGDGHAAVNGAPAVPLPASTLTRADAMQQEIPLPACSATQQLTESQKAQLDLRLAQVMMHTQVHTHTFTCAKRGGKPTDADCRLDFPRPTNSMLQSYGQGCILQPRGCSMMVDACRALSLGAHVNHANYVLMGGARHARAMAAYNAAKEAAAAAGKPFTAEPPHLLNGAAQAGLSANYAQKYQSKVSQHSDTMEGTGYTHETAPA